jgi:hypothetical protein
LLALNGRSNCVNRLIFYSFSSEKKPFKGSKSFSTDKKII